MVWTFGGNNQGRERKKKSEKENQLDKEETALGKWCIMPARENRRGDREKVE